MPATGTILFTVGYRKDEAAYKGLQDYISGFWKARVPPGVNIQMHRWDKDQVLYDALKAATTKVVLVGFSLGGCASVLTCKRLQSVNRFVDGLVLIDPVSFIWNGALDKPTRNDGKTMLPKPYDTDWVGNTWDWIVPWNAKKAACFYRSPVKAVPWSASIRGVEARVTGTTVNPSTTVIVANKDYGTPAPPKDPHGQWVFEKETIDTAVGMLV